MKSRLSFKELSVTLNPKRDAKVGAQYHSAKYFSGNGPVLWLQSNTALIYRGNIFMNIKRATRKDEGITAAQEPEYTASRPGFRSCSRVSAC